jgi:hypothetical protein
MRAASVLRPKLALDLVNFLLDRRANWRGPYLVIYFLLHWTLGGELESRWARRTATVLSQTPVNGLVDATYRKCALMAAAPLAIELGCLAIASRSAIAIVIGSRRWVRVAAVVFDRDRCRELVGAVFAPVGVTTRLTKLRW